MTVPAQDLRKRIELPDQNVKDCHNHGLNDAQQHVSAHPITGNQ